MDISQVTRGTKVLIDGVPYAAEDVNFVKPGKGQGLYKIKMRNLFTGGTLEKTYRSGDKVDEARIAALEMQYLYQEGDQFVFMDTVSFEQTFLSKEQAGNKNLYLKEGTLVIIMMMDDKPIDLQIPNFVELKVVKTVAAMKAATITAQNKMAVLETGASIEVPTFIKEGDTIKVDTRTGTYIERITTKG